MELLWVYVYMFIFSNMSVQIDYFCQSNESIFKNMNFVGVGKLVNIVERKMWFRQIKFWCVIVHNIFLRRFLLICGIG